MTEPEWKPHGEPSSSAFTRRRRPIVFLTIRRQRFVGRVMKLKLSGSKRSTPTIIFGGPSLALSLLWLSPLSAWAYRFYIEAARFVSLLGSAKRRT